MHDQEAYFQKQLARVRDAMVPGELLTNKKIRGLGIGSKAALRIRAELTNTGEIVKQGERYRVAA